MKTTICSLIMILVCGTFIFAQGSGELTKRNLTYYDCNLSSVTVKWKFSSLMGEAVINGSFSWEAGNGTKDNCLKYDDFIILKVESNSNSNVYAWVKISPTVPKAGNGFGYNVSGSPSWDDIFCGFDGSGNKKDCFSTEEAKSFWKSGFSVVDFRIMGDE